MLQPLASAPLWPRVASCKLQVAGELQLATHRGPMQCTFPKKRVINKQQEPSPSELPSRSHYLAVSLPRDLWMGWDLDAMVWDGMVWDGIGWFSIGIGMAWTCGISHLAV